MILDVMRCEYADIDGKKFNNEIATGWVVDLMSDFGAVDRIG